MGLIGKKCVVGGSGIAGLVTARVASDFFESVVLVDQDDIPTSPAARGGAPQGYHFHAVLPGGLDVLSSLFPGLTDDLDAAGSLRSKGGRDFCAYFPEGKSYNVGRYDPEPFDGGYAYVQTRALLEHTIRSRVEALSNVELRYETTISDPVFDSGCVNGVTLQAEGKKETLEADLFIDCTGKLCRTMVWLEKLGFSKPKESIVHCDFAYTSVFVKPKDYDAFEGVGFFTVPDPGGDHPTRGGAVVKMENGIWLASCGGRFGDFPPSDYDDLREWAKTLNTPLVAELTEGAEPISSPAPFKFPRSIKRHFEQMDGFPEGLLPLGDAICHFNPLYGQGMSSAALQAQALQTMLASRVDKGADLRGLAMEFFPAAHEVTRAPWLMASLADFQNEETKGDFPSYEKEALDLIIKLNEPGNDDQEGREALGLVGAMQMPLSEFIAQGWRGKTVAAD